MTANKIETYLATNPMICELYKQLVTNSWEVDAHDVSEGFLKIAKGDLHYMLNLFFGDGEKSGYLADEGADEGESPLWFTIRSCTTSPIYKLAEYTKLYHEKSKADGAAQKPLKQIVVIMPSTYIINASEEIKKWGSVGVISYGKLLDIIKNNELLKFENSAEDIDKLHKQQEPEDTQGCDDDKGDDTKPIIENTEMQTEEKPTNTSTTPSNQSPIKLKDFGLYRIDFNDDMFDSNSIMEKGTQSYFDFDSFIGILAVYGVQNISDKDVNYKFIISIENDEGCVVFENNKNGVLPPNEELNLTNRIMGSVSSVGKYTARIKFFEQEIMAYNFFISQQGAELPTNNPTDTNGVDQPIQDPMAELDAMVGLHEVKQQIKAAIAKIKLDKLRVEKGLPIKAQQLHMAFMGNPGTGKTTVAKLLGQIYKSIGVLSNGKVVVRDRSSLQTQNWGSEGELVKKAIKEARGGILFIDEAYDLVTEHGGDPGKLILSALLSAMSDESNRDFMVILAGYTMPMEQLLSKNQGLRSRLTNMHFSDYSISDMMQIADFWLNKNCYKLSDDARRYLNMCISVAYATRDENFGNARYVYNLLESKIQPAMAERVMALDYENTTMEMLTTIEACDIPNFNVEQENAEDAIAKLDKMVGLNKLKSQIRSHLDYIRFVQARRNHQITTPIPPLHMVFTGNPGTGKTSVAGYLGDIYRSLGILSIGNVIKVTRADMIDNVVGGTEAKMKALLSAARGNILFIDEAYTLFEKSGNDFGKNAVEVLLDALGKENSDMIVILAGYPKEMEELLGMNPGLKGRFPYIFNFEDYDEEELFEIAESVIRRNELTLTEDAAEALKAMIRKECKIKDSSFSNARFVVRLITTQVLPNMATRLAGETNLDKLCVVHQSDIPIESREIKMLNENLFDEDAIESALVQLDSMVGLSKVKAAIHQFVDFARTLNSKDPAQIDRYPLKWSFVGNTGTGKSSIAEILSEILKAMHLLGKGHTIEVKAEELYGVATYKADELIQQRMRESLQGLLFVDGDAPQFKAANSNFNPDYLRMCLAVNTNEIHGKFAVVIAEHESPRIALAKSLNQIGVSQFDHTLIFDDYTTEELLAILSQQLALFNVSLSADAATIMYNYIEGLAINSNTNARMMNELARTIFNMVSTTAPSTSVIQPETLANFTITPKPTKKKIGY